VRILLLSFFIPYPPDNGSKARIYNLGRALAQQHEVWLIAMDERMPTPEQETVLRSQFAQVSLFQRPAPGGRLARLRYLFTGYPPTLRQFYLPALQAEVRRVAAEFQPQVIQAGMLYMTQFLEGLPGASYTVLDEHNLEYHKELRRAEALAGPQAAYTRWRADALRRFEVGVCRSLDLVLFPAAQEAELMGAQGVATAVIPNGVDLEYYTPLPQTDNPAVAFMGTYSYAPNEDAVLYFAGKILPLIWQGNPHVRFFIIGPGATVSIQALGADPRIQVLGYVEDVRQALAEAALLVAPLRFGGGTRLKVLDGMAMQRAVVSTSLGCDGIPLNPGEQALIADRPQEFAAAVLELLAHPDKRARIAANGRRFVEAHYSWEQIGRDLLARYDRLIADGKRERYSP
jgi:glycosyltransferase involved in cell wall biosynthesis